MRHVEPKIYLIARTRIEEEETNRWMTDLYGGADFETNATSDAERLVEHAGRRCYKSHVIGANKNVTKKRDDIKDYLDNILKSGHGSVMEHPVFTFAFENVSRVFTHELVRHRVGVAISQESLRYVRLTDLGFWLPTSVQDRDLDHENLKDKKKRTRHLMIRTVQHLEKVQEELAEIWQMDDPNNKMPFSQKKKMTSMFRRLAPIGLASGIIWSGNVRILRSVFEQRGNFHAEEEIFFVFDQVIKMMKKMEPNLFQDWEYSEEHGWSPKYHKV